MTLFATERLPQPLAISAAVTNDVLSRTLVVRLPDTEVGYSRLLWREAYAALKRDDAVGASHVYATPYSDDGRRAYAVPGDLQTLKFHFPPGHSEYTALINKPGLYAIVTVDRGTSHFLNCRFLMRS